MTKSSSTTKSNGTASKSARSKTQRSRSRKASGKTAATKTRASRAAPNPLPNGAPKANPLPNGAPHPAHQLSPSDLPEPGIGFRPRFVHLRLAEAYEAAFQDGQNPSDPVIAKKLGVRRETICRWRRRNPEMFDWVLERVQRHAERLRPFVDRRVTHLAIQGDHDMAKLFYQFVARVGTPAGEGDGATAPGGFTMNFLVPAPPIPQIVQEQAAKRLPPPMVFDVVPSGVQVLSTR